MKKEQLMRLIHMMRLKCIRSGWKKAEYLKRKHVFHEMGEHCYYHPSKLPAEPHLIKMGDNVFIGSGVHLITHNMVNCVFNNMSDHLIDNGKGNPIVGTIQIGNNVFIGINASVMYGVTIGNNCIIGAGAVVTRNVCDGEVVGGVPGKVIGTFEELFEKYVSFNQDFRGNTLEINGTLWEKQMKYFWKD